MSDSLCPSKVVARTLEVAGPYDGAALLAFLAKRTVAGVEAVHGSCYTRTVRLPHGPAVMRIEVDPRRVHCGFQVSDARDVDTCVDRVRHLLDLDADSAAIDASLATHSHLAASVRANPGLRVPGHVDGFEVAVRAVIGQQISVAGARTVLGRLVATYGEAFDAGDGLTHLFPSPQALAAADPGDLPMPRSRGRALVAVASAVARGDVTLDRTAERPAVRQSLLAMPGIGPWTADYIALRALGDPDVFMATDLGVRQGLQRMGATRTGRTVADVTAAWSPWRSYALMHVWRAPERPGS